MTFACLKVRSVAFLCRTRCTAVGSSCRRWWRREIPPKSRRLRQRWRPGEFRRRTGRCRAYRRRTRHRQAAYRRRTRRWLECRRRTGHRLLAVETSSRLCLMVSWLPPVQPLLAAEWHLSWRKNRLITWGSRSQSAMESSCLRSAWNITTPSATTSSTYETPYSRLWCGGTCTLKQLLLIFVIWWSWEIGNVWSKMKAKV